MDNKGSISAYGARLGGGLTRVLAAALLCGGLDGCVVIGGSSRGGFFLWPGGLGLLFLIFLFVLLTRRR